VKTHSHLIVLVGLLTCRSALAGADDASQTLESPLAVGSGITIAASKEETALRIGLASQFAFNTAVWWQVGLQGSVEGDDSKQVFSLADGFSPGASVKLGLGYSSFDPGQYVAACNQVMGKKRQHLQAAHEAKCLAKVDQLASAMSLSLPPPAAGEKCQARAQRLLIAADGAPAAPAGAAPAAAPAPSVRRSASAERELEALREKTNPDPVAKLTRELVELLAPADLALNGGCAALANDEDPEISADYARLARRYENGGRFFKVALNALGSLKEVAYRPAQGSAFDLSDSQTALVGLPGVSLDFVYYAPPLAAGLQLGYSRTSNEAPVAVCGIATQMTEEMADFQARDCTQASLGKPETASSLFVGAALELEPLAHIGNLLLGGELLARLTTAETSGVDLFEKDSWNAELTLPLFVAAEDAPDGLRAGFAPQLGVPFKESKDVAFTVQMFVGTKFGTPSANAQ
jgi:hypothetical protein